VRFDSVRGANLAAVARDLLEAGLAQAIQDVVDRGWVGIHPPQNARGTLQIGVHRLERGECRLRFLYAAELAKTGDDITQTVRPIAIRVV